VPDHVPENAVSFCPTSAVPEIEGGEVLVGAVPAHGPVEAVTDARVE
jgi:hypothetical protein